MFTFSNGTRLMLDGATGTNMQKAGMPQGACTEEWILSHPDAVISLQKAYLEAGSDIVYAPTFGANRATLQKHGLGDKVSQLNAALVAVSREAVGHKIAVAGGMSPTSLFMEPMGDASFQDIYDIYFEQAKALKDAGVDLIVAETMMSLSEARIALLAAKEATGLPVMVTVTVDQSGHTLSGNSALACLTVLQGLGVDAFGFNCSTGPEEMLEIVNAIAPFAKVPLIAKPNAGMPKMKDGKTVFDFSPERMAEFTTKLIAAGISIIGGCCGTTPLHMSAIRKALDEAPPCTILKDTSILLAASEREAMFIDPLIDISPKVTCTQDLAEDILDMEDEFSVINIYFKTIDDIEVFAENAYMINSPLALSSPTSEILELGARRFCGRAIYDSSDSIEDDIENEQLNQIIKKYGLIKL